MSELITQNQLQEVIVGGQEVLQQSEVKISKALAVGQKILTDILTEGMNPANDERANKFLVNCRNAKTDMEAQRKPITTFFDNIRKQFTENEGKLDPKKADTFPAKIQAHRDAYVKQLREAEEKKKRDAQLKLDRDNEVISIKASIETQLSEYVQNHISDRKTKLQDSFNGITLENFDAKSKGLKDLKVDYAQSHFNLFMPSITVKFLTKDEAVALVPVVKDSKDFGLIAAVVIDEIQKFAAELQEKLPSLKTELQEMAKANAEEQKKLVKDKADREAAAAQKIKDVAAAASKAEADELERKRMSAATNSMMENTVLMDSAAPETREGFKLNITNIKGVAEVFTFWLQNEGINLSIADIEKKSIAQMKAFCEKTAHKTDNKIVSENVNYEPVYKAVNRK